LDASFGRLWACGVARGLGIASPRGKTLARRRKCLAAIHLARIGLPNIGEEAAFRLSLAAELIDAGVAPSELARELGLNPVQFDVSKYDEN
jgi:hypothetical protein